MFAEITSLALVDAVNPCTLAVQTLLLSALVLTKGKRDAFIAGVLFAFTVFLTYLLYGLGILQVIYSLGLNDVLRLILKILIMIMFVVELNAFFNYKAGFSSMEMPNFLRPYAKKSIDAIDNPLMAIPVAAICSILLLPCSSGPYLAAIMMLAPLSIISKLPWLLYYNTLFTAPMFLITGIVGIGASPKKVMEWRNKNIRVLHLIAGICLGLVLFLV